MLFKLDKLSGRITLGPNFRTLEDNLLTNNLIPFEQTKLFKAMSARHTLLEELIDILYREHDVEPLDGVRIIFEHLKFIRRACATAVVIALDLTQAYIMDLIQRVMQSGDVNFLFDNQFRTTFTLCRNMGAGGRNNKTENITLRLDEYLDRRQRSIKILPNKKYDPESKLCCTRALAAFKASVLNHPRKNLIKHSRKKIRLRLPTSYVGGWF